MLFARFVSNQNRMNRRIKGIYGTTLHELTWCNGPRAIQIKNSYLLGKHFSFLLETRRARLYRKIHCGRRTENKFFHSFFLNNTFHVSWIREKLTNKKNPRVGKKSFSLSDRAEKKTLIESAVERAFSFFASPRSIHHRLRIYIHDIAIVVIRFPRKGARCRHCSGFAKALIHSPTVSHWILDYIQQ